MIKHIQWGCIHILFWSILVFAISISGLRYGLSELDFYKTDIESLLSKQLEAPVTIASIKGVLNGIKPELVLQNIEVQPKQDNATPVKLQEIHLGFSILTAISSPLLEAIQFTIVGAKLSVSRLPSGKINIQGLPSSVDKQPEWLMRGKQYNLVDSEIHWHDKKRNAAPVQLKHVNISLHNDDQQHKIFIKTDLPEALGTSLRFAMDYTGSLFVPDSINARLFVQGKGIQLAKVITGDLPFNFSFTQGTGDFSLWSRWNAAQMTQMSGSVALHGASIKASQNPEIPVDQLDLHFKLQKKRQQWQLALKNSTLISQGINIEMAQLALSLEHNTKDELIHIALNCPLLELGPLSKFILLKKVLPADLHKQLQTIALEGKVKDLLLFANPDQRTFSINAQLEKIKTHSIDDMPGLKGLSAYIKGSEQHGVIQLNSQQLSFNAPKIFNKPLNFNHALGNIYWQHADLLEFNSPQLELHTDHFKTTTKISFTLPQGDQPAFMSLRNFFDIPNVTHAPHFIPSGVIEQDIVDWLNHAFVKGSVKQGGILFRGALADYPFVQSEGVFEVLFDAQDFELHYASGWQDIQGVSAEVRFFANSMNINIHQGHAGQAAIQQASVAIDALGASEYLTIQGDIKSDLPTAIKFLSHSPFKDKVSAIHEVIDLQGFADIQVDLKIPLGKQALKANIKASTKNAHATIIPIDLALKDINAKFRFTENGVFSKQLNATTLGFPLTAEVNSTKQAISTRISGRMAIEQLAKQFPHSFWSYLKGTSQYYAQLDFPKHGSQICTILLNSNLLGTAINFAPISKRATQSHSFALKLGLGSSGIDTFNINYEDRLSLQNRVDIKLKKIPPHWQGLIHSPIASGSVFIPIAFNKNTEINLALKELDLSALEKLEFKSDGTAMDIKNLPSIHLDSQSLYWHNKDLGSLTLRTQPTDKGLSIKRCDINSASDRLSLSGFWQQHNKQNSSSIFGQFRSQDLGVFLRQAELSNNIVDTTADLQFALNWPAAPYEVSKSILSGSIDTHLENGHILGVDPGLGRILGALDIWKLDKRLRLDFSDITDRGLSFSETTGHLSINRGIISSKNLLINAMPAKIYLSGSTNLATEQVDLQATVLPKFPIAGTIIGNISNAVSKAFIGHETGGLFVSLLYEITGTWENFKINRQLNPVLSDKY